MKHPQCDPGRAYAATRDGFLGGRVNLWQPRHGYRAGIDPVLLAASVPAQAGQSLLDLGCGVGTAMLCLAARVPGILAAGVEINPEYAALARRNAQANHSEAEVFEADIADLPAALRQRQFDHVIANPPFFDTEASSPARDSGRAGGRQGTLGPDDWIIAGTRRLRPRGFMHVIHRSQALPALLDGCARAGLGSIEVLPLAPREGRAPRLVIVRARKQGRAAFHLHPALTLHDGPVHRSDGQSYTPQLCAILREGAAICWPDKK